MSMRTGRPARRLIEVNAPAVGVEWSRVNNSGRLWWVYAVTFQLVTDATVATRAVGVVALQGDTIWVGFSTAQTQAASLTRRISGYNGVGGNDSSSSVNRLAWPSDGLWLPPGESIRSETSGLQAGDQYSEIVLRLLEFDDRAPMPPIPTAFGYFDPPERDVDV